MASKKQISANRANAKRSTGPKTPAGKRRSSRNPLKHGLTAAQHMVIGDEDPAEFERFRAEVQDDLRHDGLVQREIVKDLAGQLWRQRRVPEIDAAVLGSRPEDILIYAFNLLDRGSRKKVLKRLGQLQRRRGKECGGQVGFWADLNQALAREAPEVLRAVIETEESRDTDKSLRILARYETSLRNGISKNVALLQALRAARSVRD